MKMMKTGELLLYLFGDETHPLRAPMSVWLAQSRRFTSFAEQYRDKMRKKIRVTVDAAAIQDLRHEFETAYLLAQEKQFTVTYEPYARSRPYGPDFAIAYTTSFTFNVEATRMRRVADHVNRSVAEVEKNRQVGVLRLNVERLADTICNKLYQLIPQMINVIVIGTDGVSLQSEDAVLAAEMLRLKRRAESRDQKLFARHGFRDTSDFLKHYERLSGVLAHRVQSDEGNGWSTLWVNPHARRILPAKAATLLRRCFAPISATRTPAHRYQSRAG